MSELCIPEGLKAIYSEEDLQPLEAQLSCIKACCGSPTYSADDAKSAWNAALTQFALRQGQKDRPTKMVVDMSRDATITSWTVGDLTRESVGRVYPWAPILARSLAQYDQIVKAYAAKGSRDIWEPLKARCAEAAKAHRLAAVESLLLSHLLFAEDKEFGAFLIANMILSMPPDMVYPTHNAAMLMQMDSSTRLTLAPLVTPLQGPIYPPVPSQFGDLNAELLQTGGATALMGGGPRLSRFDTPEPPLEGGEYYAQVRAADGELLGHVDLSDLERVVMQLGHTMVGKQDEALQRLQTVISNARRPAASPRRPTNYQPRAQNTYHRGSNRARGGPYYGGEANGPAPVDSVSDKPKGKTGAPPQA
eukprot:gene608-biopygen503